MVDESNETVGIDEKTAAFIDAMNTLKSKTRKSLKALAGEIGLEEGTNNMIRAGRRKAYDEEIQELIKVFPEIVKDYPILADDVTPNMLDESMGIYKQTQPIQVVSTLIITQKKLIEKLENENLQYKTKVVRLETENATLKEILKSNSKE